MRNPLSLVGEQIANFVNFDVSRSSWFSNSYSALRGVFQGVFFSRPKMEGTVVNYDLARALYRNDNPEYLMGAGFVKPIIDRGVEYMGLPTVSSESGDNDPFLNECIRDYWAPQIVQVLRDSMRDSKAIVRYYQPRIDNPLFTIADKQHGTIQLVPPEICDLTFDPVDPCLVIRAVITHFYDFDQRTDQEIALGVAPRMYTHQIMEIITQESYTYFDKTAGTQLLSWTVPNTWKYVPLWPVYNEYSADLGGGMSDIESVMPFIKAFHDVILQTLAAHKYHSTPKVKFNVKEINQFLKNNWPDVLDESGKPRPGAKINLSGREIYFMTEGEDAGFIEAKSVLGDSKTLLLFLIDCIAISSETPKWALLVDDTAQETSASTQAFEKKIARKRMQFNEFFVMICKMALVANNKTPDTPRLTWPHIRLEDLAAKAQSFQQIVLAADISAAHEWMADSTIVKILSTLFPEINAPDIEKVLAKKNLQIETSAPAPASDTSALPPSAPGPSGGRETATQQITAKAGSNGTGSKAAGKKALATTKASKS